MFDGLAFLPSADHLLPFMAAAIALNLTPGADMTYVISRSLAQGRGAGIASAFGIFGGSAVHTLLAAVGVSALLAASAVGFEILKWVGAAYLLYLAIKLFLEKVGPDGLAAAKPASLWRIWAEGVVVNVLNPKVALFILAFLPQFTEPAKGLVWAQILVLGTLFNISGTIVNCGVAVLAGGLAERLRRRPRIKVWMNRVTATILGALAVRLALSERH